MDKRCGRNQRNGRRLRRFRSAAHRRTVNEYGLRERMTQEGVRTQQVDLQLLIKKLGVSGFTLYSDPILRV
jgi:hypothetical protein